MRAYNIPPKMIESYPKNYQTDVSVNIEYITLTFNTDLDANHLMGYFQLRSQDGKLIPSVISYKDRVVTLRLQSKLKNNHTYTVTIIGDSQLKDEEVLGIRNVFGIPLQGNVHITFTTEKAPSPTKPKLISPFDYEKIHHQPTFSWTEISVAKEYEIQVSKTKDFQTFVWANNRISSNQATPSIPLSYGDYYWRVRAIDENGKAGEWSDIFYFVYIDEKEAPAVTKEDVSFIEYDEAESGYGVEIVDMFPKEDAIQVSPTLRCVVFDVHGDVRPEEIEIEMEGYSILEEGEEPHIVDGTIETETLDNGLTRVYYWFKKVE